MALKLKNWLFYQLPKRVADKDTLKNAQGEGITQRYLQTFGTELDTEVIPFIEDFTDILGISTTPAKFLPYFGWNLGKVPNPTLSDADYRRLLSFIVAIYKSKGTLCSYQLLFNIFGLGVSIVLAPLPIPTQFDSGQLFDSGNQFDIKKCGVCQEYDLVYFASNSNPTTGAMGSIPPALVNSLNQAICLIQPITLKLRNFAMGLALHQSLTPSMDNDLTISTLAANTFDAGLLFDDSETFDTFVAISTNTYNF